MHYRSNSGEMEMEIMRDFPICTKHWPEELGGLLNQDNFFRVSLLHCPGSSFNCETKWAKESPVLCWPGSVFSGGQGRNLNLLWQFRTESQIKAPSKPEWLERSFEANHPNKNSRTAILFLHGRMGKGRRAVVPECIGRLPFNPIPLKCRFYHFHILHLLFFSGQSSRDVPWGRWQLHGFQEEGGWREYVLKVQFYLKLSNLCEIYTTVTQKVLIIGTGSL